MPTFKGLFKHTRMPQLRRSLMGRVHENSSLKHPWPLLSDELCVHLLKTVLLRTSIDTFVALLSAFPVLSKHVNFVTDGQSFMGPRLRAIDIWDLRSVENYDEKPLVVFVLAFAGRSHKRLDIFRSLQRHSYYFTPGSFVLLEVPNRHCFQLEAFRYVVQSTGATILPTVVRYDVALYRNYQCLTEIGPQTPQTAHLFLERSLITKNGWMYYFDREWEGNEVRCLDVVDVEHIEKLEFFLGLPQLRAQITRSCTDEQCRYNKVYLPTFGRVLMRLSVVFRGCDVPTVYHNLFNRPHPLGEYRPRTHLDIWRRASFTLVNLDWSPQNFHGTTHCPDPERHREGENPQWRSVVEGPMYFTTRYNDIFYVGVPIETVLRSNFNSCARTLVWKRLTRLNPYVNPKAVRLGGPLVIQDLFSERFRMLIHPLHRVIEDKVEIQAKYLTSLKIWSHLNELEPFPLFVLPRLKTMVLVALSNSQISWNINQLIKPQSNPSIERAVIGVIGTINPSHKLVLAWIEYSILAPSVIDLTLVGYTLDKFCGPNSQGSSFDKLQSLSIDVTNLPFSKNSRGQQRLHIRVSPLDFPKIKHLDLSSAYDGTLAFPVVGECHTEVWVPKTCVSVRASTALAAYPLSINGKLVGNGGDQGVRDGRWRVWWMRIGEEFVYKETLRLPIDPDIVEMNR